MSSQEYYCTICLHRWRLKKDYDKHLVCCEFFHNLRKQKYEMDEFGVKIPNQKELFLYVRELALKCERLEQKVKKLEANASLKQKKMVLEVLNHPNNKPEITFSELIRNKCTVSREMLFMIFKYNLTEGLKLALTPLFIDTTTEGYTESNQKRIKKKLPIKAFTQKKGYVYVYDIALGEEKPKWMELYNDTIENNIIINIGQKYLREYLKWEDEQEDIFMNEEKMSESIRYRQKVNGTNIVLKEQIKDIKTWIYNKIEENIKIIDVEYD